MILLKKALATAATVAVVLMGGSASAALPLSDNLAVGSITSGTGSYVTATLSAGPTSSPIVLAANEEPGSGHHYDPKEFERQSAVLAPKDGDNTRLYVFGALGIVLAILLTLVICNRKKWGGSA